MDDFRRVSLGACNTRCAAYRLRVLWVLLDSPLFMCRPAKLYSASWDINIASPFFF